jgi:ubiquinone/menaquinone biosynthesis C-methylase UbiE
MTAAFSPTEIAEFWEKHPCGEDYAGGSEWKEFFQRYDEYKYRTEPHILDELRHIDFRGKRVLEIGLGQGAEAQKIIEAGAVYNGIDLTNESVQRVKMRCSLFGLPYESIQVMNAERMTFPDGSFDIVFSHGVIHHSPRIQAIVKEIHRVLRDEGKAVVMVYHKNSLNYHVSIKIMRRLGIFLLWIPGVASLVSKLTGEPLERLELHAKNLKAVGREYLRMRTFIHKATDGPENVFSSIFSRAEGEQLFCNFRDVKTSCHLLNERHFPIVRSLLSQSMKRRLAQRLGWHLWITGMK